MQEILLLLMLLIANGSPLVARALFGDHLARPIDGGLRFAEQPLFGPSKTWRGLLTAVLVATLSAPILGFDWHIGAIVGALAMLGDLLSSFVKRRLGLRSGARAIGLDHLPESLLPLLACVPLLGLTLGHALGISLTFMLVDLLLSRALYAIGIGDHPH